MACWLICEAARNPYENSVTVIFPVVSAKITVNCVKLRIFEVARTSETMVKVNPVATEVKCPDCQAIFKGVGCKSSMRRHRMESCPKSKGVYPQHRCLVCDQTFKRVSALRTHVASTHNEYPYELPASRPRSLKQQQSAAFRHACRRQKQRSKAQDAISSSMCMLSNTLQRNMHHVATKFRQAVIESLRCTILDLHRMEVMTTEEIAQTSSFPPSISDVSSYFSIDANIGLDNNNLE